MLAVSLRTHIDWRPLLLHSPYPSYMPKNYIFLRVSMILLIVALHVNNLLYEANAFIAATDYWYG